MSAKLPSIQGERSTLITRPRRILVRIPTWVGDAVMATPVLRALRAAHPQAEIVAEARPVLEDLLRGLPSFDRFLADPRAGGRGLLERTRRLRDAGFDWAVLLPDSQRAVLAPALAGIPRRAGYARDPLRRLLLTDALPVPRSQGKRMAVPMTDATCESPGPWAFPTRGRLSSSPWTIAPGSGWRSGSPTTGSPSTIRSRW